MCCIHVCFLYSNMYGGKGPLIHFGKTLYYVSLDFMVNSDFFFGKLNVEKTNQLH